MNPAICLLPVIPMRKEPSHRSEMVSQLLFGEFVQVHESDEQFSRITCEYDGYEGWVQSNQLETTDNLFESKNFTTGWVEEVKLNESIVHVPMAVPVYKELVAGNTEIEYSSPLERYWDSRKHQLNENEVFKIASQYLETSYLWGGRSNFGIDCSGFVQQVYKLFGIKLLRDASMQVGQGNSVNGLDEALPCDLAFFNNEAGRITHVGIVLSNNKIIHASGKVRIDKLTAEGIFNSANDKQTHRLHSIRRFL
jgi:gamma-D-glutamyl-L-lysine dipeptidyl-peptidase